VAGVSFLLDGDWSECDGLAEARPGEAAKGFERNSSSTGEALAQPLTTPAA
jgi:hypothetical protein